MARGLDTPALRSVPGTLPPHLYRRRPRRKRRGAPPPLPSNAALFLNFDGTLLDCPPSIDRVTLPTQTRDLVLKLHRSLDGAVAIVTGRSLAEIDRLLAPAMLPGSGLHGAEQRLTANDPVEPVIATDTGDLADALRDRLRDDGRIEIIDRQMTVTVYYGQAPERASECRDAVRELTLWRDDMEIVEQDLAIGVRPCGANAGLVIDALMRRPPFAGRLPVYVGDDTPDEEGFSAARALGGFAVKVRGGTSTANFNEYSIAGVLDWLDQAAPSHH